MRIVVNEYAKGGHAAYETSNDGGELVGVLTGPQRIGERVCAFIEVGCDSDEKGYDRLLAAMEWLAAEIRKRKAATTTSVAG